MSQNFVVPRHKWQERSNTKHACGENTKYSVCNLPCNNSVNMSFAHCNTCVCVLLIRALVFTVHIRRHFGQTEDFQRKSSSSVSFEGLFQSTIVTFSRYHTLEDRVLRLNSAACPSRVPARHIARMPRRVRPPACHVKFWTHPTHAAEFSQRRGGRKARGEQASDVTCLGSLMDAIGPAFVQLFG